MKASETTLRELLEGTKQFQIPLFQRRYSWEKKNWTTLWDDLMNIYNGEVEDEYFIGTIVTQSTPGTANGVSPFIVIDGQQRLTTLSLLLVILRNCFGTKGNKNAEAEINEQYLINKFKEDKGEDYYKILPTQTDKETYKNIIKYKTEAEFLEQSSNIYQAFIFFDKSVNSPKNDIDPEKLKNIILNKLLLVNITSEDRDNPYLIFESLNNKGLDLTQSDLIRNYVFMKFSQTEREEIYQNQWLPLEKRFKSHNLSSSTEELKELTQSFWFYLRKDGMFVAEKEIYKKMKDQFDESNNKHQQLQELIRFSSYYEKLKFPDRESELHQNLSALLRLDFKTCYVFLLNIYDIYEKNEISLAEFQEILRILESYLVRRFFTDNSTVIYGKVFDSLYKDLRAKDDCRSIIDKLKSVLTEFTGNKVFPTNDDFRKGFINKEIYKSKENDRVKFILERIEGSFKSKTKEILKVESSNLSIEHIMSQKLNNDWKKHLGDDFNSIHSERLHTIGNLTLTADNSGLSNNCFIQKKKLYQESKLTLSSYFDPINSWNAEEIEKRANYLADIAIKVWAR